jgi:asparagine synthase (glutamine-hydrolysing)
VRTAPAPLFLLSALVRRHGFKVVLTGEGADEFLAGYDIFKEAMVRRFWARNPSSRWRPLALRRLSRWVPDLQAGSPAYLESFFKQGLAETADPHYSHALRWSEQCGAPQTPLCERSARGARGL